MSLDSRMQKSQEEKGELSYYGWAAKMPSSQEQAPPPEVKKLSAEEAAKLEQDGKQPGAAWNKGGTFEERTYTQWAKGRFQELTVGKKVAFTGGEASIAELFLFKGDATVNIVRGKARCGFCLEPTLKWKGELSPNMVNTEKAEGQEIDGKIHFQEVDETEIDEVEFRVEVESGKPKISSAMKESVSKALQSLRPFFVECFETLYNELKQKAPLT